MTFRDVARAAHRRATEPIGSVQRVADVEGQFVLTYDDGPDPRYTPGILEALRDFNATATFFVLLSKVDRNPNLLREVKAAGHESRFYLYVSVILAVGLLTVILMPDTRKASLIKED